MHGGSHLIGFDFLAVDPGAGLFGHGRELFGGAGNLGYAIADSANQLAQAAGHPLDRLLYLAQFVAAIGLNVMAQVA